jgi:TrmH family RNA methyltransferase
MEQITSRANPLMTHIRKLQSSRSYRRQSGEFLCDGVKMLEEAVKWGADIHTVVATEKITLPKLPSVRVVQVPESLMKSISPMEAPQGVLFLCGMKELAPPEALEGSRYLVLDGLQDPGNVGSIWRTADALGADGLVLVNGSADPYNHKTVRATMGAVFRLPVYETTVEGLAQLCQNSSLPLYATALRDDTVTLGQFSLGRCAVAIGSEGKGASPELLAQCEKTIKIPMEPQCESLNAAAAAAVVLWEWYRGN